jgi:HD-like signal output (HDOD) protein
VRKRILFVDDESSWLNQLRDAFRGQESEWEMSFVDGGTAALAAMEQRSYDVIITDMQMPGMTGAQLLNEVGRRQPKTVRFILADSTDKDLVMKCVLGSHQFLTKPCEPDLLKDRIHRALVLDQWLGNDSLKSLVSRIRTFPSIPSLYFEVLKELNSPNASAQRVGEIIARDLAMTTKLLQMINSAFFGLARQITDPTEAVTILGFETVKSLVLCIQVFAQFDKVKPTYFSIDRLWRHSTAVALASRNIAQVEGADAEEQEEAYMAGLLHDLGKLVLVSNFGDQYDGAQTLARKNQLPLWDVERDLFGAAHSDIGAYLLGLWGLPLGVAEAAALHHAPLRQDEQRFNSLTAVHAANVLIQSEKPEPDGFVLPTLDTAYLAKLNLAERVPVWSECLTGKPLRKPAPKTEPAAPAQAKPAAQTTRAPVPAAATAEKNTAPAPAPEEAELLAEPKSWWVPVLTALAAIILVWILWPKSEPSTANVPSPSNELVDTTTEVAEPPAVSTPGVAATEPQPVAAPAPAPPTEPAIKTNAEPAVVSQSAPAKPVVAAQDPFAQFKVQSILFQTNNPLVMINGKVLKPKQTLGEATVVAIYPRSVTLQIGAEKKTLAFTNSP